MRRFSTIIALALCTLLCVSISSAQQTSTIAATGSTSVPNLIRYSGTLKDAQGAALVSTAPVGVTFAIYNQEDGGAATWQETQNVTPEANGQYSVILGSTTVAGLPSDLFSQQEQRWLGVQVQGQEEQARVLLVSVPYALKAHEADTLGGMPASAIIQAATLGAAGLTSANGTSVNALSNVGTPPGARGKDGKLPPNGCTEVSGWITYWNINGALCQSSIFQQIGGVFNGYIGILTTHPTTPLEVGGAITADQWYDITTGEVPFLSVGWPASNVRVANQNTWLGAYAGGQGTANISDTGADNTFVGYSAGKVNTSGTQNTFVGDNAGFANTDSDNTCVGSSACKQHNTGSGNTMVGNMAGMSDTNGLNNSFLGDSAGINNVGSDNTIVGFDAGYNNQGNENAILGYEAGNNNTASNNVFYGYKAGFRNITDGNSFLGYKSGMLNTTGFDNTFVGYQAGLSNTSANGSTTFGQENTFVGYNAGKSSMTSQGNTFVGSNSGLVSGSNNTNDCCNTFVGKNAGMASQTSNNTLVGYRAGEMTTGGDNTFIGTKAGLFNVGGFDNVYVGSAGGTNATGNHNTFMGVLAGGSLTAGNSNIFVGFEAGGNEVNINSNIEIGNTGPAPSFAGNGGNNTILIGTNGSNPGQQNAVFISPILSNANTLTSVVTINPNGANAGQLGYTTITTGTGNVVGPPSPCPANYLTGWAGGYNTYCSREYELPSPAYLGVNVGPTPMAALDVNGLTNSGINTTDTRQSYMIGLHPVLSIFPYANSSLFVGADTGSGGLFNTFVGEGAGKTAVVNTSTFVGSGAGNGSTSVFSTFMGASAGGTSTGNLNDFFGQNAGVSNTGSNNSFFGATAGAHNTGNNNVFVGESAGINNNGGGSGNTFVGVMAGIHNTSGSTNIFIGGNSGDNIVTGSNDIDIGNLGVASDNDVIRIGTSQTDTYIQGIYNSTIGVASVVCVDPSGKLGTKYTSCNLALQDQIKAQMEQLIAQQQQQIESLQKQNTEFQQQNAKFQQRLARLESLVANK